MPSYQEIEMRLNVVEDKLDFLMNSMRMKVARANGLFKADGTPDYSTIDGSLLEIYRMVKTQGLSTASADELN